MPCGKANSHARPNRFRPTGPTRRRATCIRQDLLDGGDATGSVQSRSLKLAMTNTPTHSVEAAMIEPNQTAFILKVTRPDEAELSGQLVMFYVAITTSEDEALAIVRRAVKADATVEPTGVRLSQQTASALDLEVGLARAL